MTLAPDRRRVSVVPHTHWDREWYAPFQTFRMRLVDLLDDLLSRLDDDPSFAHFMLDGQMAVIDDYLAVRPEAEPVLRRLAASGRLSVGPWYVLMDEFLVSGECMVRNLQRGLERANAFGGAMEIGYLPDMFGHVAQMPQILRQAGFEHAVVWRGVPAAVDRSAFWWSAPDGSTVRAEYLLGGYGNGARLPADGAGLLDAIDAFADSWAGFLDGGPVLWMNGTDHLMPQPGLGRVVAEANAAGDAVADGAPAGVPWRLRVTTLAEHLRAAPVEGLPSWSGELRSGARANLLMGVASNRVDVHQAEARAARALEQEAEPLSALALPAGRWPEALLSEAWLACIHNSAHDSICACSHDDVASAVLHRYAEALHIADGLSERAVTAIGAAVEGGALLAVNPSPRARSGLVEVVVPADVPVTAAQVVDQPPAETVLAELDLAASARVVRRELTYDRELRSVCIESVRTGEVLWRAEREPGNAVGVGRAGAELDTLAHSDVHPGPVRVRVTRDPVCRVVLAATAVAGYGWGPVDATPPPGPVRGWDRALGNDRVVVEVAGDGTWAVNGHGGLGRIVHGGDVGDTYNWCPPPDGTEITDADEVTVTALEHGPLRARLRIDASYRWPEHHDGVLVDVDVVTTLELRAGDSLVRATTGWHNHTRDQRVRAWFALPEPAAHSDAECAFAVVTRGLQAEGGATEAPLPTYPSRRFVRAGGLTVAHEGLAEYELTDIRQGRAHALALTLARCTGMLSQGPMPTRPLPAGPEHPLLGPQLQGPVSVRYAVSLDAGAEPYAVVDDAFAALAPVRAGGGHRPAAGSLLAIDLGTAQVSSLRRSAGHLELRVFNPTDLATTVAVPGRRGRLVDLRGRAVDDFDGSFVLAAGRIATARLDPAGPSDT
ncbi:MAG: alpha-mannosidase [Acidimicrobiia bacterium]